jgi:hypothetical protein
MLFGHSPNQRNAIRSEMGIAARQRHVFSHSLRDKQAVKGIAVMMWELANDRDVSRANGQ